MSDITGNSSTNRAPARHSGTGGGVSGESDQAPTHHRLDLAGNRQVNSVLHLMQVPQIRSHPPARDYIDRERAEQEARRAHKRHLANVVIRRMWADHTRRHEAGAQLPAAAAACQRSLESTFSPVRARTHITKGPGNKQAGLAMVFKLLEAAEQRWWAVNGPHLVALVRAGGEVREGQAGRATQGGARGED